jgi:TatD DNase family protein
LRHSAIEWPEIPLCQRQGVRFVDSHMHLDALDAEGTVPWAKSADAVLFACGVDRKTSGALLSVAAASPDVVNPFVGVHPSEADREVGLDWLEGAAKRAVGMGEIGLDPTYSPIEEGGPQMRAFRVQVELAGRLRKPVQVHSRMAESKCLEALAASGTSRVLMHWLESEEALPKVMDMGYFVSFGPALLYSRKLHRMAMRADPSLVLLETDSPVLYSPLGRVKGPMLIPSVAFKLAEIWGKGFRDTLEACNGNALRFAGLGKG